MELAQLLPPQPLDFDPVIEFEAELEQAARELDVEPWLVQRLKHPEREIAINIPVIAEGGSSLNITGYRVQHSRTSGPCMGPVIVSRAAHPADLRLTATAITLQCRLMGLRLGGAAGAIVCDQSRLEEPELRRAIDEYVRALREDSGPELDIFVPQGPEWLIRCMRNAAHHSRGQNQPAALVGDPKLADAAATAIAALIRRAMNREDLSEVRVAIQGYGHRARLLAGALQREHASIVAVADRSGAVMRSDGLDLRALNAFSNDAGVIFGFPNADAGTNADLLESPCDVLVLAAAPHQIGPHNAAHVRARTIVELTQDAVAVPMDRLPNESLVIPYLLAGCAQLAVWAYEWRQGLSYSDLSLREAADDAGARLLAAYEAVHASASPRGSDLRHGAVVAAVRQFAETLRP